MALEMCGTKEFPDRVRLLKFLRQVTGKTEKAAQRLLDQVGAGVEVALQQAADYGRQHTEAARFVERITEVLHAGLKRVKK